MKKHSFIFTLACISSLFFGCKTVEKQTLTTVDPLSLIDSDNSFYIAIPTKVDTELSFNILKNNLKNVSESDIKTITQKIDKVYLGLNREKNVNIIQGALEADIPVKYIPKILTQKNGWSNKNFVPENGNNLYKIYDYNSLSVSFPSNNIVCLGRNIEHMLSEYDKIHFIPAEESLNKQYSQIKDDLYKYLKGADNEIRFYASNPQSYLTMFMGTSLDLKLIDVSGAFKIDPDYPDQYLLDFAFAFKSSSFLTRGKALLSLAFGLTNADCETPTDNILIVKNIHIEKSKLYKILVL